MLVQSRPPFTNKPKVSYFHLIVKNLNVKGSQTISALGLKKLVWRRQDLKKKL